jgi:hypothetical protein
MEVAVPLVGFVLVRTSKRHPVVLCVDFIDVQSIVFISIGVSCHCHWRETDDIFVAQGCLTRHGARSLTSEMMGICLELKNQTGLACSI